MGRKRNEGNNTILVIPVKPLSVNMAWQGRRYKTAKYKKYERDCALFVPQGNSPKIREIRISLILKNPLRQDADNIVKPLLDILQKRGQIKNDRYIERIFIERIKGDEDKIIVELKK